MATENSFVQTYRVSARVWDNFFKDISWLQKIMALKSPYTSPSNPTLVGYDLTRVYYDSKSIYIALFVFDWTGDSAFHKKKNSLHH
jgi:hypothetical protein